LSKVMYVMRGLPGSGKSTRARELGEGGVILSTDDFFVHDGNGKYEFDPARILEAHQWNQERALDAVKRGVSPVVIDNTNVKAEFARPYAEMAAANGYEIKVVEPDSPWWTLKPDMTPETREELVSELLKRNTHGVPREVIEKMLSQWEHGLTPEGILGGKPRTAGWVARNCRMGK